MALGEPNRNLSASLAVLQLPQAQQDRDQQQLAHENQCRVPQLSPPAGTHSVRWDQSSQCSV